MYIYISVFTLEPYILISLLNEVTLRPDDTTPPNTPRMTKPANTQIVITIFAATVVGTKSPYLF